ncbi:hypothetical protein LIER_03389 [Lithospermum erythrorhizon]|uniref:Uncharacterized protein n=1 Tax=Lithospermum erythrorhizon TaxID=34254 RepID=A0AAV3NXM0_LITER
MTFSIELVTALPEPLLDWFALPLVFPEFLFFKNFLTRTGSPDLVIVHLSESLVPPIPPRYYRLEKNLAATYYEVFLVALGITTSPPLSSVRHIPQRCSGLRSCQTYFGVHQL